MRSYGWLLICAVLSACAAPPRENLPRVTPRSDWAQWPRGTEVGQVSAVDVDSHGHVFVLHRPGRDWSEPFSSNPILVPVAAMFDRSGRLLKEWGADQTTMPHGLSVAPDDSIWITDDQREQLLHFSHDGRLLQTLGERSVSGNTATRFGGPTDVAATPDALFVSDGYINNRVIRIGRTTTWWGEKAGTDAGFAVPHSVAIRNGRLAVADREYSRVKIYDLTGRLLAIYPQRGHPYAAKWLPDGRLVVLEGRDPRGYEGAVLRLLGQDGKLQRSIDLTQGENTTRGHDLAIGPDGTIYIADVTGRRVLTVPLSALTRG